VPAQKDHPLGWSFCFVKNFFLTDQS